MNTQKPLPEVGKLYHFWDDGKSSPSRHYICKVERIVPYNEAENIVIKDIPEYDDDQNLSYVDKNLIQCWLPQRDFCDWLYDKKTDYFIEVSCPNYDEYNLWFVRTKSGGWFSLDIQNSWQGGELDVTGEIFKRIIEDYKAWGDTSVYFEAKYEKEN